MQQYLDLLGEILIVGERRSDRTGVGTTSLFGRRLRFDLGRGFPLVTTKKVHLPSVIGELLWFLSGSTNIKGLHERGVTIWDEWADEHGELGPVYGHQWRGWPTTEGTCIDQIANLVHGIRTDPWSRRHIISAWNVGDVENMALPPCHMMAQFYVHDDRSLSCQMYQRSADAFLGLPFNIASYALLTHFVARVCRLGVGDLSIMLGDVHIYDNHREQVCTQRTRVPNRLPRLVWNESYTITSIDHITEDTFTIVGYDHHPAIKADVAV